MSAILDVRDLHLRRGDRTILAGATFSLAHGGVAALMGPSGPARRRFFVRSPDSNVSTRERLMSRVFGFRAGRKPSAILSRASAARSVSSFSFITCSTI